MLSWSFVEMNLPLIPQSRNDPSLAIEKLAGNQTLSEKEKIAEASRQFESVLIRQILSEARKPMFDVKKAEQSATTGIYQDMVTNQLAEAVSRSGDFGLAQCLIRDLAGKFENAPTTIRSGNSVATPHALEP
jgi:Rod binding domain-containing protein